MTPKRLRLTKQAERRGCSHCFEDDHDDEDKADLVAARRVAMKMDAAF